MKQLFFITILVLLSTAVFSQKQISGKTPARDVNLSTADYSNGIPVLAATAEFVEPSGNNLLDAEESAQIKIKITNSGTNAAFDVGVNVKVDNRNDLSYNVTNKTFGEIAPNKTVTTTINISATQNIQNTSRKFDISFTEHQGFVARPISYEIQTQKFREPKLVFIETGIEELEGNKNNKIEQGELILATVLIQNKGQGTAVNSKFEFKGFTKALIKTKINDYPTSGNIGDLAPGESKTIKLAFSATWNYNDTDIPLKIKLTESREKYGGNFDLGLKMNVQQLSAVDMKQQGTYQQNVDIQDVSLTSDIDKNIPQNAQNTNRFALIIGNEHYVENNGLAVDVPYAINDAFIFKDFAHKTFGIPENQIIYKNDALAGEMKVKINNFVALMKNNPDAEFFVYYAGHGYYDDNSAPYIMPVNVKHTNIEDAIKLSDFYKKLTQFPTKRVSVFIDACFSGGGRGEDGLVPGRASVYRPPNATPIEGNMVVFTASSQKETAKPYNEKKHGIFTYFLLKKIKETKGEVSYSELDKYLQKKVCNHSVVNFEEEQNPKVKVSNKIKAEWENWSFK